MRIPNESPILSVASTTPGLTTGRLTHVVRGTIRAFNATTYEATVQIAGSTATYLAGIPANLAIPVGAIRAGARCAVAFFNPTDPDDACVIALYGRPPYRDDPDYIVIGSSLLNAGALAGSALFYLDQDRLNEGGLG